jgi:hypothetical protein
MAAVYPGGNVSGTYVPNFEASGRMVIGYSRNPKDFPINQYVTLVPVKESTGYYLKRTVENAARILLSSVADRAWPDGNDAPTGVDNTESAEYFKFLTERYCYAFRMGYKAVDQADWQIVAAHAADMAQQAMTGRTDFVTAIIETSGNYGGNTATATSIGGDFLNNGTADGSGSGYVYKKALQGAGIAINKATFATVKPKDLVARLTPDLADPISRSKEIHAYLKESPFALAQVRGDVESQNGLWGLPDSLYGFKHVIEDAVINPNKKGASSQALSYVASSNVLPILARPGKLIGVQGAPSFSTIHVWVYEEMTVESKDDADNRRHTGRVVDDFGADLVSYPSGYLITLVLHT